ncbi:cbb3-type cytochrome c oxidase subunit 3 [Reinekea sp.]|jgi:cytochrome c oxidase cbb3-type subunit 4|uniref:cbb3-type cytochrome oxidase subunit 3 n=1 Tax=Reinekea sp. TaxID=1970455 RepID=UPI002A7EBBEA|nr:cbb3-type cytochrome c oxidase subunit 3 [Reinekea sp.]
MDINDLRALATVFTTVAFGAVCVWAYSGKNKKRFDEAANIPFADEPTATDERITGEQK